MNVVVTGGCGFIGSHVVDALQAEGHEVTILDYEIKKTETRCIQTDIRDQVALERAFKAYGQDGVFHIAGMANARAALDDPVAAVDINIKGTTCVLDSARKSDVNRVIFASTVWFYNAVDRGHKPDQTAADGLRYLDETEPLLTQGGGHVYTTSKVACELLCHDFQKLYGQDFTVLRYGIPYGPRMWPGLALRAFLDNAFGGTPIRIFGDGSAIRRFLYVEDIARAHVAALKDAATNETFNLEGARDVTIKELADTVAKFVDNVEIEYIIEPNRRGELTMDGIAISNQKAKTELGWGPDTDLEEGVRRTVEWYEANVIGK